MFHFFLSHSFFFFFHLYKLYFCCHFWSFLWHFISFNFLASSTLFSVLLFPGACFFIAFIVFRVCCFNNFSLIFIFTKPFPYDKIYKLFYSHHVLLVSLFFFASYSHLTTIAHVRTICMWCDTNAKHYKKEAFMRLIVSVCVCRFKNKNPMKKKWFFRTSVFLWQTKTKKKKEK